MSKKHNLLTKYFKKDKITVVNQSPTEPNMEINEENEGEACSFKRLKLHENNDLTTSTSLALPIYSITSSTYSMTSTCSTTSPTYSITSTSSAPPVCSIKSSTYSITSTSSAPPVCSIKSSTYSITSTCSATSPTYSTISTYSAASPTSSAPPTCSIMSPTYSITSTCSTTSSASLRSPTYSTTSPRERDPCHGPSATKQFVFLGPYQPDLKFPTVNNRHFYRQWYSMYSWLEYSEVKDRAFCFVCRLSYGSGKTDDSFTVTGFSVWKNDPSRFKRHQSSVCHKEALQTWETMKQNYSNNTDVLKLMDKQHAKQAAENRAYLIEIIRTIVFLDLLKQQIQNEILKHCHRAKYYSIMIDETTDIGCHEQVSLILRYVDDKLNVYEKFIGFERTSAMTGEALYELVVEWLNKLGLKLENLVGQCYDGGSNMRGEYKGVAARLRQVAPLGLYVHCNGHILNLCLVDVSARVPSVRNNFGVVSSLYNLIEGSAKRYQVFENIQKEAGLQTLTVKQLCETRWTCRFECLKVILLRFNEIITTLDVINVPEAFLLLNSLQSFDFIYHLVIMSEIYILTNILSKFLQLSNISLTDALVQVKTTVDALKSLRNEHEFQKLYNEAMKIADAYDIEPPKDIRRKKIPARLGGGVDAATELSVKDYYRINIYYIILDTIITSINNRFDENVIGVIVLMEKLFLSKELLNENELHDLSKTYSISYDDLKAEQRLYKVNMKQQKMNLAEATTFILENNYHLAFSSMNELLKVLWTIPVNSCEYTEISNYFDDSTSDIDTEISSYSDDSTSGSDEKELPSRENKTQFLNWKRGKFVPKSLNFNNDTAGIASDLDLENDPIDYFELFFNQKIMEYVAEETNRYQQQNPSASTSTSHQAQWYATNFKEMYVFIRDAPIPIPTNSNPWNWLELVGIGNRIGWNWPELELVGIGIGIGRNWSELELELVWNWLELVGIGVELIGIGMELARNRLELVWNWPVLVAISID
ncbi:unnamed protein product [Rotaria sp. Silwood2]|nr:unnamed protein product [Rotaria sp. Silwood2]